MEPTRPRAVAQAPSRALDRLVPDGGVDDRAMLDFDSNAQCVIDGRRAENLIIKQSPPKGAYTVRVDTANMCAVSAARWHLRVLRDGR